MNNQIINEYTKTNQFFLRMGINMRDDEDLELLQYECELHKAEDRDYFENELIILREAYDDRLL